MFYNSGGSPRYDIMGNPIGGQSGLPGFTGGMGVGTNPNTNPAGLPNLPGLPPYGYDPRYGGIPGTSNPAGSQSQALGGNIRNFGDIASLTRLLDQIAGQQADRTNAANLTQADRINQLNRGQTEWETQHNAQIAALNAAHNRSITEENTRRNIAQAQLLSQLNQQAIRHEMEDYIPGLTGLLNQSATNTRQGLEGMVSDSTRRALTQMAMERNAGIGGGVDSPNANAALLAVLGHTSEQLQQQAEQNLTAAANRVPHAPSMTAPFAELPFDNVPFGNTPFANPPFAQPRQFDPSSFLISPQQQWEAQQQANWLSAAPVPGAAASANMNSFNRGLGNGRNALTPSPFDAGYNRQSQSPIAPPTRGWNTQGTMPANYQHGFPTVYTPAGANTNSGVGNRFDFGAAESGDQGQAAYENYYGESLPPGTGYDPATDTMYQLPDYGWEDTGQGDQYGYTNEEDYYGY